MPIVLALLATVLFLLAPAAVAAHDLEPTAAEPDVVVVIDASLSPREVRVAAGSVVGWVNRDGERHRIRSRSGPAEFDSGNLGSGMRFAVRLATPGTYAYVDDRDRDDTAYHGRIVVTAAGGGGSTGSGGSSGGGGSTGDGAAAASVSAAIGDRVFSPSSLRVAVGGTITWTNEDDRDHTVTATGGAFESGVMASGDTFRQAFPTAGTFAFLCALHPEMRGEVEVVGAGAGERAAAEPTPTPAATVAPTPTPTPAATATPPTDGAASAPVAVSVTMRDGAFGPAAVTVVEGGTVTFANEGAAPHTATAADGTFDTGMVTSGASASITLVGPGSYAFVCTFHPEMQGSIEVIAAPPPATSPSPTSPSPTSTPGEGAAAAVARDAGPGSGPAETTAVATTSSRALDGFVGLMVGVILVSVAAALFARAIGGTVRRPR